MEKEFVLGEVILLEKFPSEKIIASTCKRGYRYIRKGRYKCFCGKEFIAIISNIRRGITRSCGCFKAQGTRRTHGDSESRLYNIFQGMISRCCNTISKSFPRYGGRGIKVCNKWLKGYTHFREWALANGYNEKLSIDRINNDGDYEPSNCRWATPSEQSQNRGPKKSLCPKSKYKGVNFKENYIKNPWYAYITVNYKYMHLGYFRTEINATKAYNGAAIKYFGEFANLNIISV